MRREFLILKTNTMKKELYLCEGCIDFDNSLITEDRYIIVDTEGMDLYGEHFSEQQANEIIGNERL